MITILQAQIEEAETRLNRLRRYQYVTWAIAGMQTALTLFALWCFALIAAWPWLIVAGLGVCGALYAVRSIRKGRVLIDEIDAELVKVTVAYRNLVDGVS